MKNGIINKIKFNSKINIFSNTTEEDIVVLFYSALEDEEDFDKIYDYAKRKKYKEKTLIKEFTKAVLLKIRDSDFPIKLLSSLDINVILIAINELYNDKNNLDLRTLILKLAKYDTNILEEITLYFMENPNIEVFHSIISIYFDKDFIEHKEHEKEKNYYEEYKLFKLIIQLKIWGERSSSMFILESYINSLEFTQIDTLEEYELENVIRAIIKKEMIIYDTRRASEISERFSFVLEEIKYRIEEPFKTKIIGIIISEIKRSRNVSASIRFVKVFPNLRNELEEVFNEKNDILKLRNH